MGRNTAGEAGGNRATLVPPRRFAPRLGLWCGVALLVLCVVAWAAYAPLWQPGYAPATSAPLLTPQPDGVNLNTATAAQLAVLPGIGPAKAQAIVDYRAANGPFTSVDELLNISGIGEKTLENLLEYVYI